MTRAQRGALAVGLLTAVAAATAWLVSSAAPPAVDPGDARLVASGERLYAQHCAACHGAHLEGQPNWRERLPNGRLPAPPHNEEGHTWHHPDRQLFEMTRNGAAGILPGNQSDMPGFKGILSDREIWAVLSFIASTWPPAIQERQRRITEQSDAPR